MRGLCLRMSKEEMLETWTKIAAGRKKRFSHRLDVENERIGVEDELQTSNMLELYKRQQIKSGIDVAKGVFWISFILSNHRPLEAHL